MEKTMIYDHNCLIFCDAIQLLERLPSGRVKLAYLDPPWGTFNEFSGVKFSVDELAGYLSKIVQQISRILSAEGSLIVRWSQRSPLDVRLLINQVFDGQPKYEITWHRKWYGNVVSKGPVVDNEYFLVYSCSSSPTHNTIFRPFSTDESAAYSLYDECGRFKATSLVATHNRPKLQFNWRGYTLPPGRSWRYSFDTLESLAQENRIYFTSPGSLPSLKKYLHEQPGVALGTTWDDISAFVPIKEKVAYPLQTPVALMERIIQIASDKDDLILDPFCGSGTTIIAAQTLERRWLGADRSPEAVQIAIERIRNACQLDPNKEYDVLDQSKILSFPIASDSYRKIVLNIGEIAKLQKEISSLTDHLLSLKKLMNIGDNDDEQRVEDFIEKMGDWITESVAKQFSSVDSYISEVCSWLSGWDQLDAASQTFLPQAEFLFDHFASTDSKDYSMFIIQYCRTLENELLKKIFTTYSNDIYNRIDNIDSFLANDLSDKDKKTYKFADFIKKRKTTYTLGDMNFIMGLTKVGGKNLGESALLQDFRIYTIQYFNENIMEEKYLRQINMINNDFRTKSAHPNVLDFEVAKRCRDQVRSCLNELIMSYRGQGEVN